MPTAASYKFGPFLVDGGGYRLLRDGQNIPLSPKIIDLLLFLAARPSVLVSKDDLFRALWPDVAVTDNALTQAVSELRQALGDDPANPKFVQTVARRGYRFGRGGGRAGRHGDDAAAGIAAAADADSGRARFR